MVSKRKNEGITMNVRYSKTSNNEAGAFSVHAELNDEKITDMQQLNWNHIDWKLVESHVNRIQVRITKAVIE
ncbi:hypothetical protein [Methanococcoides burtonii]|uniref:hypothetical protein n=1 Tax=Methanococcoides burtonii TaxID=29291 RepID=UPI0000398FFC|nr:hypothetical protein [Methanococcoides burtonii]